MLIDCSTCEVRGAACGDCVVSVLLGPTRLYDEVTEVDDVERRAISVLADAGLVPHLRHSARGANRQAAAG